MLRLVNDNRKDKHVGFAATSKKIIILLARHFL